MVGVALLDPEGAEQGHRPSHAPDRGQRSPRHGAHAVSGTASTSRSLHATVGPPAATCASSASHSATVPAQVYVAARRWAAHAAAAGRVEVVDILPRYHPSWARWVARTPGLREVASWNVVLVLRVR